MSETWGTFGGRLRWAIEQLPRDGRKHGIRHFARRMEKAFPDIPGTSYNSVTSYLKPAGAEPSFAFATAAADMLAVRLEWLVAGRGAPVGSPRPDGSGPAEEELRGVSSAVYGALGVATMVDVDGEMTQRFFASAVWAPIARRAAVRLYQLRPAWALMSGAPDAEVRVPAGEDAYWAAVRAMADAIGAPLRTLEIDGSRIPLSDLGDYVEQLALVLGRIMRAYVPTSPSTPED